MTNLITKTNPHPKVNSQDWINEENPANVIRACALLHNHLIPCVERIEGQVRVLNSVAYSFKCACYTKKENLMICGLMVQYAVLAKYHREQPDPDL